MLVFSRLCVCVTLRCVPGKMLLYKGEAGKKDMTPEDEPCRLEGVQYATRKGWGQFLALPTNEAAGQNGLSTQAWMCLVVKVSPML